MRRRLPRFDRNLNPPRPIRSEDLADRPGQFHTGNLNEFGSNQWNGSGKNAGGASSARICESRVQA
jgi:hypothetical protein